MKWASIAVWWEYNNEHNEIRLYTYLWFYYYAEICNCKKKHTHTKITFIDTILDTYSILNRTVVLGMALISMPMENEE